MAILATTSVTDGDKDASPDACEGWIVFLHGILGSGSNWRSFARQIVTARPSLGALLVDLRLHGESLDVEPPHTLASAAADIVETLDQEKKIAKAILGHSFGGKVGIELARQLGGRGNAADHLFVIDSTPGARPDHRGSSGVRHIVELLTQLPAEFKDRNEFTAWIEERGVDRPTAMWLAMNVRPVPNTTRFVFRIDIPKVRGMMDDYFAQDLWDVIENPPGNMTTHLISGAKSQVLDEADIARARKLGPKGTMDVVPNAGHWVHVDAPDVLREIVLGHLPA
jgi:esterase